MQDSRVQLVELTAPMQGTIARVERGLGQSVDQHSSLMAVVAPPLPPVAVAAGAAGVVHELRVGVGDEVEAGDVLAVLSTTTDEPATATEEGGDDSVDYEGWVAAALALFDISDIL